MYRKIVCITGFICLGFLPYGFSAEETRTWRDATGKFSVDAVVHQLEEKNVKLKKTDGKVITLLRTQLSKEDQRYLDGLAEDNPFEQEQIPSDEDEVVDDTNTTAADADRPAPNKTLFSFGNQKVQTVNLLGTRNAAVNVPSDWSAQPDPLPTQVSQAEPRRWVFRFQNASPQSMPRRTDFFVDSTGTKALSAFHFSQIGRREKGQEKTQIFFVEGDTPQTFETPLKLTPLGFSPDGTRFLFLQDDWEFAAQGKKTLLHIADVTGNTSGNAVIEPFTSLKNPSSLIKNEADIESARWVDNEHIFVQSEKGTLLLLNTQSGKGLWQSKASRPSAIAVSPTGKYCFIAVGNKTEYRETLSGKLIGIVEDTFLQKFRFSPDGKHFATCNARGIVIGDATTGKMESPFFVSGCTQGANFFWLDDRLLCFSGHIVDTVTKTGIWDYVGMQADSKYEAGCCWCFFERHLDSITIVGLMIPHTKTTIPDANTKAEFLLQPGAAVALTFDPSMDKDQEAIRKCIEKKVADNGWKLQDSAPVTLVLKTTDEKKDSTQYVASPIRFMPLGREGTEIEYKPQRFDLSIMHDKSVLWNMDSVTRPPSNISVDELSEKSLKEVVDKAMSEQTYLKWLDTLTIPSYIALPANKGTTRVTESGLK